MRLRNNTTDTRTFRRQPTMRRESATIRRQSVTNDVQLSMMPDLSEFSANEKTTWLEIQEIKAMPIPMSQKKEIKAKLQVGSCLRLQGYEQFKWKRRKFWEKTKTRMQDIYQKMELWRGTLKTIEGNFGTGVVSYFLFIKWLIFLNLFTFTLLFLVVILPTILFGYENPTKCATGEQPNSPECCSASYFNTTSDTNIVQDLFQGTGEMEKTLFFYGHYPNVIFDYIIQDNLLYYNMPLAYVAVTVVCFLLTLFAIVRAASEGFKERLVEGEGQFYMYCNMIFGSWDFCIENQKSAAKKHEAIFKEIKSSLESERLEEERKSRTRDEKTKIIIMRCLFHMLVLTILAAACFLIYIVFEYSTSNTDKINRDESKTSLFFVDDDVVRLLNEFLPSIVIVFLNMAVPLLFNTVAQFENYSPVIQVRLSLLRTIVLRLASLGILYVSIYVKVNGTRSDDQCSLHQNMPCWETFVGQQMYKLALTDFANHIVMTFVVNFIRSRIGKFESKCAKFVGAQSFELPRHVLDVIYLQTVCWFGSFYAPFLPLMVTVIFILMFHIKKFACLVNSQPSLILYRVSRSNSMFMLVLLLSFFFAFFPVVFSIAEFQPSKSCGPFRGVSTAWEIVTDTFHTLPSPVQSIFSFLTTAGFAVPVLILLLLLLYYYTAVTMANRHMVVVLKNQLVLEGHDKQFLLEKLSSFIKQQQKRMRQIDTAKDGDRNVASN